MTLSLNEPSNDGAIDVVVFDDNEDHKGVFVQATRLSIKAPSTGDTLGFSITTTLFQDAGDSDESADDGAGHGARRRTYAVIEVNPIVNGHDLLAKPGLFFNTFRVLMQRIRPNAFDAYLCGCGDAGCAGIFRSVQQTVDAEASDEASLVRWSFPVSEFKGRLVAGLAQRGQDYVLEFERAYFEAVLDALYDHLKGLDEHLGATLDVPATLMPDYDPSRMLEGPRCSLFEHLPKAKAWLHEHLDQQEAEQEAFGDLYHQELRAVMPNGRTYGLQPTTLAFLMAEIVLGEDNDGTDLSHYAQTEIAPLWDGNEEGVLASARSLTWDVLDGVAFLLQEGPGDQTESGRQELDMATMNDLWARATLSLATVQKD